MHRERLRFENRQAFDAFADPEYEKAGSVICPRAETTTLILEPAIPNIDITAEFLERRAERMSMIVILKSVAPFVIAGFCEIGGGYLVWQRLRDGRGAVLGAAGGLIGRRESSPLHADAVSGGDWHLSKNPRKAPESSLPGTK